ncbi:MAG: NAD-glutamate dehydrogenase domain-containing protein, partial [Marinobacterium sp.]
STDSETALSPQDLAAIETRVLEISGSWDDDLQTHLIATLGEEEGGRLAQGFRGAFPIAYRAHFSAQQALDDIRQLNRLAGETKVCLHFYQDAGLPGDELRFKLYCPGEPLVLSDIIPMLENLGMRVLGEHPYILTCADGTSFGISDFRVSCPASGEMLENGKRELQRAVEPVWQGRAENDVFNQLIMRAGMDWRDVALLRAYGRYMKQLRFGFSQHFIADTLSRHLDIAGLLLAYFRAKFEPDMTRDDDRQALLERLEQDILQQLDQVETLDDDRILRRFYILMKATLRTNYYQCNEQGQPKAYFSFKLEPSVIPDIPQPRPRFEIFVYSPQVEGVHLRTGRIARGGLRWSDRIEDYRTEVLGLVKAQQVKNSVIVPAGAKGCFIVKQPPQAGGREALHAEGVACYQTFIRGLLDLADNLVAGQVVPPTAVVRHDEDDPYLVVAADKGTATFSDIANRIAEEYGFWLGDAFASGGSEGYDHKKMGITARGAWESVKRHFHERGLDTQTQPFTVVGIGDMGGDVFGNGMLLSDQIRLVGAFNHQHIFIDPAPNEALSFQERKRLFELPGSSWGDYDASLISKGGGVFSRSAKWIPVSDEMRAVLDIDTQRLTPHELIQALLTAPVDLLWNGGIGTYIKARQESHEAVGDKSNDGLRINADQLRCKVLGEGGNLGATQRGRIEFALSGGAANTDFIDNAGGVDCSDHEVNIKILLNECVQQGDMSLAERNQMLRDMTPEVAELVLSNNYRQAFALSIATAGASRCLEDHVRFIKRLEEAGKLDRALECLPADDELQQRRANAQGLTRPELSVLISYAKIELKQALVQAWIARDLRFADALYDAFPLSLRERFPEAIEQHRLRA